MIKQWTVGIFLFDDVEVLDFAGPFEVFSVTTCPSKDNHMLEHKPFIVKTVSETGDIVHACNGLRIQPSYSFEDAPHFDILVIPGGLGARKQEIYNNTVIQWLIERMKTVQLMTSVCTGAFLLAKAGLLNGKRVTTHWASYNQLQNDFPETIVQKDTKFIDEGNIITSGGVSSGINMSLYIVKRLLGDEVAQTTAREMEYDISI